MVAEQQGLFQMFASYQCRLFQVGDGPRDAQKTSQSTSGQMLRPRDALEFARGGRIETARLQQLTSAESC